MELLQHSIQNLEDWSRLFQNAEVFAPLIRHILNLHGLPQEKIVNTTPGSNAVFRVGKYIVKIFAPDDIGWDCAEDFATEIFTMERANGLGISVPQLIAHGVIEDRYLIRYLVMEFVHGVEFGKIRLTDEQKYDVGVQVREICAKMNTPCERFNSYDFIADSLENDEWDSFPESFRRERAAYIQNHRHGEAVCVHGDIHVDNAIYGEDGRVWLLDFADSVIAPVEYEYAALIPGLFRMQKPYLDGFFGEWDLEKLTEKLTYGLCLHKFGALILADRLCKHLTVDSINTVRRAIAAAIK